MPNDSLLFTTQYQVKTIVDEPHESSQATNPGRIQDNTGTILPAHF